MQYNDMYFYVVHNLSIFQRTQTRKSGCREREARGVEEESQIKNTYLGYQLLLCHISRFALASRAGLFKARLS